MSDEREKCKEREHHRLLFGVYPEMTEREKIEQIVWAWAEKHGEDGSLVPLCDELIAAGYGDVAEARNEMVEKCEQHFRDRAAVERENGKRHEAAIYNAAANEIAALAQQKEPSNG